MIRILVWGTGKRCKEFVREVDNEKCKIIAFVETHPGKGSSSIEPQNISKIDFDMLIVTPDRPTEIIDQINKQDIEMDKICILNIDDICDPEKYVHAISFLRQILDEKVYYRRIYNYFMAYKYNVVVIKSVTLLNKNKYLKKYFEVADQVGYMQRVNSFFCSEYFDIDYKIGRDDFSNFFYIKDKKVYVPQTWDKQKVRCYALETAIKLDKRSPEYENEKSTGKIFVDIGVTDGLFELFYGNQFNFIYLLNVSKEWENVIKRTLCSLKEKIRYSLPKRLREGIDFLRISDTKSAIEITLEVTKKYTVHKFRTMVWYHAMDEINLKKSIVIENYLLKSSKGYIYYPYDYVDIENIGFRKAYIDGILKSNCLYRNRKRIYM